MPTRENGRDEPVIREALKGVPQISNFALWDVLPVIGPLDDVVAVVLLLRYAARAIPRDVVLEAWPAEPRLLQRLLGPSGSS